ncbi:MULTISPECIES: methionine ABC transporter permease [unclassified Gilliamella]|uniref:methionine ABC transporter permease n=1 Tax=unclassified Gilliamella TaxID=2685620 RepID=UPI001CE6A699|nr:methionine ABC transporter permease MetI [Gilliamella sp. B3722]MCX8608184.1 methionine ABC transporter permease MetI [Gilliamella sp. B3771]MCX8611674.1 methionine ABC transporter permease MetI [Gilliamella sp. B3891]MCX8614150.1 methionine ABC transporter permease MetI [Gilliamella sp. B3773]MCX8616171.1 methionine ABC transporter permease MetI [Gilliamella sp. B3770]MCX8618104.1 methionine ABC transporter permease MetI [Gilliamella sp. B2923]MCX8621446.1 methionine ABC transporter perme
MLFKMAQATDETLYMVILSGFWGTVIGLPIGILLYTTRKGQILDCYAANSVISFITNIFRSIPFIILIVWIIPFTTFLMGTFIGKQAAVVPLSIGVSPLIARMIENALLDVPKGLIEAARSMGATPLQIIYKVLLPESLPVIVNSMTITLITLTGYIAMAGAVGAGGLGQLAIQYGYNGYKPAIMNTVLVILIIIVFIIQFIGNSIVKRVTHH